jgi:hypothetical protein
MNPHQSAAAALATLATLVLGACDDGTSANAGEPSVSPSATPATGPSPTDVTSSYNTLGPRTRTDLEPGRWAVTASGPHDLPLAVAAVPEGLSGGGGYIWTVGGTPQNDGWIFGYWSVGDVHLNPCTTAGGTFDTKSSPDLFVEALAAQRRTTTTRAVPVEIDGYDGIYVELRSPTNLDYSSCRSGGLAIFDTTAGDRHLIDTPGVVERYWVLDVDGKRVALTGAVLPETTHEQVEQLTELVQSVRFEASPETNGRTR